MREIFGSAELEGFEVQGFGSQVSAKTPVRDSQLS